MTNARHDISNKQRVIRDAAQCHQLGRLDRVSSENTKTNNNNIFFTAAIALTCASLFVVSVSSMILSVSMFITPTA